MPLYIRPSSHEKLLVILCIGSTDSVKVVIAFNDEVDAEWTNDWTNSNYSMIVQGHRMFKKVHFFHCRGWMDLNKNILRFMRERGFTSNLDKQCKFMHDICISIKYCMLYIINRCCNWPVIA